MSRLVRYRSRTGDHRGVYRRLHSLPPASQAAHLRGLLGECPERLCDAAPKERCDSATSILVARRSAAADLLTSCVPTASRLVISRRSPSMLAVTGSLSASIKSAGRFFGYGPRALPDYPFLKRVCTGGSPRPTA
jgi:hypothetical protein